MTIHVMLDLETFGTAPDSAILQVGAAQFDPQGIGMISVLNIPVDPQSCQEAGLSIDLNTILWWMNQPDEPRKRVSSPQRKREPLKEALRTLAHWIPREAKVWGNGAAFDLPILESAYKACKMPVPWKHWDERCYRTLKAMAPNIKMERRGVHHDALDDAVSQAEHLQSIIRFLGLKHV